MKIIIFYFSGTGNTKLITKEIANNLEKSNNQVKTYSIEHLEQFNSSQADDLAVGIGFPVYKFSYPKILEKLFPVLQELKSQTNNAIPLFTYCTYCRFASNSIRQLATVVERLGYNSIAQKSFKCPSNGIASMKEPQSYEYQTVMYFENGIDLSIDQYVSTILGNLECFEKDSFNISYHDSLFDRIRLKIVDKVEEAKYPRLNIDQSLCNLCGTCVKGCPEQNLKKTDEKISIKDDKDCLHCLRCMHRCPQQAISFGELTTGPQRYTPHIQKELFQKATLTPIDAPEPSSKKIRRIWAINSIKYWLTH